MPPRQQYVPTAENAQDLSIRWVTKGTLCPWIPVDVLLLGCEGNVFTSTQSFNDSESIIFFLSVGLSLLVLSILNKYFILVTND